MEQNEILTLGVDVDDVTINIGTGEVKPTVYPLATLAQKLEEELGSSMGRPGLSHILRIALCADYFRLRANERITQENYVKLCNEVYRIEISIATFQRYLKEFRQSQGTQRRILGELTKNVNT